MTDKDFTEILGGISRDENGKIVGAKAVLHNFFGKMNSTQALVEVHSLMDAVGVYVSDTFELLRHVCNFQFVQMTSKMRHTSSTG